MKEIILGAMLFYIPCGNVAARYGTQQTTGPGTIGELQMALNTTDAVWLLQRNYKIEGHRCVHAVIRHLEKFDYEFFQYYYDSEGLKKNHLYAQLSHAVGNTQGAQMIISEKKGDPNGRKYVVLHYEKEHHCAIINSVETKDGRSTRMCEAHIWNRDLAKGLKRCLELYTEYCDYHGEFKDVTQTVYNQDCHAFPGC